MNKKFMALLESELSQAECVLAAKAISDKLQSVAENLAKIEANDLMPMMGTLKLEFGEQMANDFYTTASTQLRQLLANMTDGKNQIDSSIVRMEGVLNGDTTAGNDMAANAGLDDQEGAGAPPMDDQGGPAPDPNAAPPTDDGSDDTDGGMFAPEDGDQNAPPEGRERKTESIKYLDRVLVESFKKLLEKKVPVSRAAKFLAEKFDLQVQDIIDVIKEAKEASEPKKEPTAAQIKALRAFADANGKNWKSRLSKQWEDGTCKSSSLVVVRNNFGPSWLKKFKLPVELKEFNTPPSDFTTIDARKHAFNTDENFIVRRSPDGIWGCYGNKSGFCYSSNQDENLINKVRDRLQDMKANPNAPVKITKD